MNIKEYIKPETAIILLDAKILYDGDIKATWDNNFATKKSTWEPEEDVEDDFGW